MVELGVIICLIAAIVFSTYGNWKTIMNNKAEAKELDGEYTSLLEEEKIKKSEETKLQDDEYLARYAREKYYYSKGDELIIRILDDDSDE